MYFVMKMIESCLDLTLSVFCGMIIPLLRLNYPDGKEVMCLRYHLWMEALSECTNIWLRLD